MEDLLPRNRLASADQILYAALSGQPDEQGSSW